MAYTDYAPYNRPESGKTVNSESQFGHEYVYVYPDAESLPEILVGEEWEDGNAVTSADVTPSLQNSGYSEARVSTVYSRSAAAIGSGEADLEETKYSLRPNVSQVELSMHPDFLPGGSSDLYTTPVTSGTMTEIPLVFVTNWENEPNSTLKAKRQFYQRDGNGVALPYSSPVAITVPAGAATAYVKLRQLGFTTKDVYNPVWQIIKRYKGANAPVSAVSGWGQYVAAASVPDLPTGIDTFYPDWIKTGEVLEQIGAANRWQITTEYTGYTKVYFDVDTLNPAGHTLP